MVSKNQSIEENTEPLSALFLTESLSELNEGASFLDHLSEIELKTIRDRGERISYKKGEPVFLQGTNHNGIFQIEKGRVRTYCVAPSGRELTLAYWSPGHFIGGPEIFGGAHLWSAEVTENSEMVLLSGKLVNSLISEIPNFARCLINGLVSKGKCYSQLAQMLGTRTIPQRLAHLLLVLAQVHGEKVSEGYLITRHVTHEEIADIVGSTRQWISMTIERWQKEGLLMRKKRQIIIRNPDGLSNVAIK